MGVLGAEAPPAGLPQGTLLNCVSGLVSATPKAIGELGFGSMSPLAQNSVGFQVIFPWFYIGWSLSRKDAWDARTTGGEEGGGRWRWGASDKEVLLKTGADGAGREVAFYCKQLGLSVVFFLVEVQALSLDASQGVMVGSESVHIGQDPGISESYECGVDKEAGSVSGMEDVEVSVLDPMMVKIGGGVSFSIKRSGILRLAFTLSTDQVCFFIDGPKANIFCYFRLVLLVEEDQRVVASVTGIKEGPSNTWMGRVI